MSGLIRVGVFSDSHGCQTALKDALRKAGKLDYALFLGDYSWDARVLTDEGIPTGIVRGNNDFSSDAPDDLTVELGGVRIFCTHGHRYGVYFDLYKLCAAAREHDAAVALFGHTHRPCMEMDGPLLLLNPGSVAEPRGGAETFAVLSIKDGAARADIQYVYR